MYVTVGWKSDSVSTYLDLFDIPVGDTQKGKSSQDTYHQASVSVVAPAPASRSHSPNNQQRTTLTGFR